MNPRYNTSESIKMEERGSTRRGVKGLVKGLLAFKQRHNFHSNLYPLGPTHQDDYTNRRHQAHWTGLDGQFVAPRHWIRPRQHRGRYGRTRGPRTIKKRKTRSYLVVFTNLTDQIGKCLIHIDPLLSRSLNKATSEMLCQITTLCACG